MRKHTGNASQWGKMRRGIEREHRQCTLNGSETLEWKIWKVRAEGSLAITQTAHPRGETTAQQRSEHRLVSDALGITTHVSWFVFPIKVPCQGLMENKSGRRIY